MANLAFWPLLGVLLGVGFMLNLLIVPRILARYYHLLAVPRQWWNHTGTVLLLMVAAILVGIWISFGDIGLLLLVPLLWFGPLMLIIDIGCLILPNRLTLPFGILSLLVVLLAGALAEDYSKTVYAILISVMVFIVTAPLGYVRIGIGGGDLKLLPSLIALTTTYSWHTLLYFIMFSSLGAGLWALWLVVGRRAHPYTQLPLGPWLILGAYLSFLV